MVTYKYDPTTEGKPAVTIHMDDETVDFIPMMPSHMGGDTVVRFEKANVIYIEDFYRNFGYPFADQANGGSIKGMLKAIDLLEKLADDNTILVPGHGTLVHKKDMLPYRAMLVDLIAEVTKMRNAGKSLKDVEVAVRSQRPMTRPHWATHNRARTASSANSMLRPSPCRPSWTAGVLCRGTTREQRGRHALLLQKNGIAIY